MLVDVDTFGDIPLLNRDGKGIGQSTGIEGSNPNYNPRQQGVFALHPLMTPKYARNNGLRDAEFRDTMARIYISLADSDPATQAAYLASLPEEAQVLAQILLGSNNQGASGYIDFIMTAAMEATQEVVQVEKVVSDDYVAFFFGQAPPTFQYSGFLLNSLQDDQRSGFAIAYQHLLRGTSLARHGALARLRYDSVIVEGVMTAQQQTLNAENELAVQFSFSFLVKSYNVVPSPLFKRTTTADYLKLVADTAVNNLGPVGRPSDVRVRSTMVLPPDLSSAPSAGQSEPGVVNRNLTPMGQLMERVTGIVTEPASSNVRGAVDGSSTLPPSPLANGHAVAIRNGVRVDAVTGEPL
jgi:hypothetical protein